MSRRSRFQNLERSRAEREAPPPARESGRFAALGQEPAPARPLQPELDVAGRFRAPDPADAPLELVERGQDDQPFIRCARCEADNGAHAQGCFNCGASFASAEQRAFNERLWSQRREERAREREELARLEEQRQGALSAEERQRGEMLAVLATTETLRRMEAGGSGIWRRRRSFGELVERLLWRVPPKALKTAYAVLGLTLLVLLLLPSTRRYVVGGALLIFVFWFNAKFGGRRRSTWRH